MIGRRGFILTGAAASVAACARRVDEAPVIRPYTGPEVTAVVVWKGRRQLATMHGADVLGYYDFQLGFSPEGHKQFEGDGRTPEGQYFIDRKNPRSQYHLSVGISYPNAVDRAYARAQGRSPGGDIFIHGTPNSQFGKPDWTAGCLAVTNREVEDLYSMLRIGTPIVLLA